MNNERVLVVDDEPGVLEVIVNSIRHFSPATEVYQATSRHEALEAMAHFRPHLVFLDLNLGRQRDGLRLCQAIRGHPATAATSIIIVTGDDSSESEIRLLQAGADDFIRKGDFSPERLVCRMHAVLRRSEGQVRRSVLHGPLAIDPERREVLLEERSLNLSPREFDILSQLVVAPDRAVSREELTGTDNTATTTTGRAIDVHVACLRKKLGAHAYLIETVTGVGYRIGRPRQAMPYRALPQAS